MARPPRTDFDVRAYTSRDSTQLRNACIRLIDHVYKEARYGTPQPAWEITSNPPGPWKRITHAYSPLISQSEWDAACCSEDAHWMTVPDAWVDQRLSDRGLIRTASPASHLRAEIRCLDEGRVKLNILVVKHACVRCHQLLDPSPLALVNHVLNCARPVCTSCGSVPPIIFQALMLRGVDPTNRVIMDFEDRCFFKKGCRPVASANPDAYLHRQRMGRVTYLPALVNKRFQYVDKKRKLCISCIIESTKNEAAMRNEQLEYTAYFRGISTSIRIDAFPNRNFALRINPCRPEDVCSKCQIHGNSIAPLWFCGGCKTALYCSKECFKKHWATHKPQCHTVAQKPMPPAGTPAV